MTDANPNIQIIDYQDFGQPGFGMLVLLKISGKWQVRFKNYLVGQTTEEAIIYVADNGRAYTYEKARRYFSPKYTMAEADYLQPSMNAQ